MIDLQKLRENPQLFKDACTKKGIRFDIDAFLELDTQRKQELAQFEELKAIQNKVSKELPKLQGDQKQAKLAEMKELAEKLKKLSTQEKEVEARWKAEQLKIPSLPSAQVPDGKEDSENVEIRTIGELPTFNFKPKSHIELGSALGIIDIERGVKIAGARNYFLIGDGMRLQHALLQYSLDKLCTKGYTPMDPPHIVTFEAMMGTGYFPGGEDQSYHLDERDDKYLIGTSEVSIASFHMNEILASSELPKRYCGYSPCYRREAGTYGKDTAGLYRIHQFYKIEQVVICEASEQTSSSLHAELLGNAEELMQDLKLPYRVVNVCGGDLGQGQVFKNDIETWMPSRESYGETHSCSTFHDYQARRLKLRYKNENGKNTFCHTLNNTLVASPRILIPILEMYQNEDGTITIPEVLRPYMGGKDRIG